MSDFVIPNVRTDRGRLIDVLSANGATMRGNACRCPFHDDRHASAGVYERPDGAWAFKCHVCGINEDVIGLAARFRNSTSGEVIREMREDAEPRKAHKVYADVAAIKAAVRGVEAVYPYTNPATGKPDLVVVRYRDDRGKRFIQFRPTRGGFEMGAPEKPWPLFNRIRIAAAETVIVCEGEKAVSALTSPSLIAAGIIATTAPCGAGKAEYADWTPLAGKQVIVWPDNDDKGHEHARDVARLVATVAGSVRWVNLPLFDLPPKGDAVEWREAWVSDGDDTDLLAALRTVIDTATDAEPARESELGSRIEDMIAGKYRAVDWPWRSISALTRALLPGTITVICGDPGGRKSAMLIQALAFWHEQGIRVAVFELEDDRAYHLNRVLAQRAGNVNLLNPDWVAANPETARALYRDHKAFADAFATYMADAPDREISLDELIAWVRKVARAGCRIIAIDPITAAGSSDKPWNDDRKFVLQTKAIMREFGASLIVVTHPRGGASKGEAAMDSLAGGRAWSRFPQCVLWLKAHEAKDERVRYYLADNRIEEVQTVNAHIKLAKVRNGPGGGQDVAMWFDADTLRFRELGTVVKDKARERVPLPPRTKDPFGGTRKAPACCPDLEGV
jgi:hypothetical protein